MRGISPGRFARILVRMPNWVGDVVMATPALRAVRKAWPAARITALCLPSGERVLRGSPRIDRFEVYDRRGKDRGRAGRGRLIRRLRAGEYDLAIVLPNSFSSAWLVRRARIPRRAGAAYGGRGFLLTDRYAPRMEGRRRVPRSMVEHYSDVIGILGVSRPQTRLELFETEEGRRRAEEKLSRMGAAKGDRFLALSPGASFGPSKVWLPERYAAVADAVGERYGLRPLLLGGPGEEPLLRRIEEQMKIPALSTADCLLGLDELKTAVRRSALMLATDAGPRHYAVAFDVPVVVLMGPTDPRYSESNLERSVVLRRDDLPCVPCHEKVCPLERHLCMEGIEVERVVAACDGLLAK